MPNQRWTIKTSDGEFGAYVATPEGQGPWPAVVVIQEIFGVNRFVREVADRMAGLGYVAVAPDLFWRIEPGVDITDQTPEEWKQAFGYYQAFNVDKGVADIAATIAAARARPDVSGKVGAVGYCLGGLLAFLTAARTDVDATVSYYGGGTDGRLGEAGGISKPLLIHLAGQDEYIPEAAQAKIKEALKGMPGVEIHIYPGRDHAFTRTGGANYDAADAQLANGRTAAFFKRNLG